MMRPFTIAPAETGELADAAALFRAYAAALDVDLGFQGFEQELADLPGAYAPPQGALLLARGEDDALGCIALRRLDESACEMKRLYVRPAARGTGLGRALIAAALAEATRLGYREITLDTLPQLDAAIALYRSFGFQLIPPYGDHPYEGTLCFGKIV
jgi:putative acetyltransferase